ncbi:MAG TPA: hypothetical protein VNE41_07190 [Chitinophagaceae bacterium]|nr:hypothetical protein [Chitinophagaceae bacterium]
MASRVPGIKSFFGGAGSPGTDWIPAYHFRFIAVFYFMAFNAVPLMARLKIIGSLRYGIFVWLIMNLIVIP